MVAQPCWTVSVEDSLPVTLGAPEPTGLCRRGGSGGGPHRLTWPGWPGLQEQLGLELGFELLAAKGKREKGGDLAAPQEGPFHASVSTHTQGRADLRTPAPGSSPRTTPLPHLHPAPPP